jgi:single-strand DNA-binding protein
MSTATADSGTDRKLFKDTNKLEMTGWLARNPEIRYRTNSQAVTTFDLCSTEEYPVQGEVRKRECWVTVVMYGPDGEKFAGEGQKGDWIGIIGKLQQRRWETEDGQKRAKHEIVAFSAEVKRKARTSTQS